MSGLFRSSVNTSMAHVCGNVTSVVMNHCKNSFPKGFFKSSNINTRLAIKDFKEIDDRYGFLSLKKEKPIISITPKLTTEETEFNIDFVRRRYQKPTTLDSTRPSFHDIKFFKDFEKNLFIDFSVERMKMEFEMVYVVSTAMQQYNMVGYMVNNFRFDQPFYQQFLMECEIPKAVINQLSKDSGVPVYDESGSVKPFIDYVNTNSTTIISYRFKASEKKYKFFMLIPGNMLLTFDGRPNPDDGDREGQTSDNFKVTHNVTVEFNYPSVFYYISGLVHDRIETSGGDMLIEGMTTTDIIPLLTIQMPEVYARLEDGKMLSLSTSFEIEDVVKDVTDISSLFDSSTHEFHSIAKQYKINMNEIYKIILYRENHKYPEDKYSIDWETFELTVMDAGKELTPEFQLVIYEDNALINELKEKLYNRDLIPTKTYIVLGSDEKETE